MTTPGFTAERSLVQRRRHYGVRRWRGVAAGVVRAQDNGAEAPGTCCGTHCPGLCICHHGVGKCVGGDEGSSAATVLRAGASVAMASVDSCHSDDGLHAAFCNTAHWCGCYASPHDAGCLPCIVHH